MYLKEGLDPPLPEVTNGEYLIGLLDEVGYMTESGMGSLPLSWQEIKSWSECYGVDLEYWELQAIKNLSYAYVSEVSHGDEDDRPAPFRKQEIQENLDDKLSSALRSFKNLKR